MSASKKTAWAVTAAALLPLLTAAPALADTVDNKEEKQPKPPARMSSVGGTLLAVPGTQVKLGPGAPVLPKELSARSWIVADAETGHVLASHNAHWPLAPASTLKMLFADTVLPKFPRTATHTVTPQDLAGVGAGSSLVGIKEKQTYTVHDLWLGVFLRSGNDAVRVLSAMNGGLGQTVEDMNARADELQALDTHVESPDGYDAPGQVSSAYDLTLIARSGMQKPDFREYAATARAAFPGEQKPGKKRETFEIQNTNRLLTGALGIAPYQGIAGVKNGNTTHAGSTFTGVAERNGKVLLVTVLNPSSKEQHAVYKETARLLDWGFAAAGKVQPVGELVPPKSARTNPTAEGDGSSPAPGENAPGSDTAKAAAAEKSGGVGVALGVVGGVLVLLAGGVLLVNRRWPLPELVRRRPRTDAPAGSDTSTGPDAPAGPGSPPAPGAPAGPGAP
ncbi:D-alanyl-D-alanine carboxypeptidase [Streptomyces sp. Je 1-79]|uniref:D-alanyl-D-alanine carboxypeptidase family protein n=1 Tax=Streptomyces sp. Je 1-79 TaxID=2943847 RepID=UPI0021A3D4B2|nr:D-alanyl-D-alanine carboxypeptidase [Streptomyces sp. Je 1-79]MCT4355677.1 D-alanyl-D-alanine carboxypeptidase [Streptomyces sp. Je 1-79]